MAVVDWWMQMLAAFVGGLTVQVGWLGLGVGGHPAVILRLLNEPDELLQWLCHDDSTVNIIMVLLFTCYFHRNTVRFLPIICISQRQISDEWPVNFKKLLLT